jgi:NAD(P)-dependent dehydrogenase (short-subunit alcohol dehydrogenase family)
VRLDQKVAIITGGAGGMGSEIARTFADEGAHVLLMDRVADDGVAVARAITDSGRKALFVESDVTSTSDWAAATETAVREFGSLHILVNCAGVSAVDGNALATGDEFDPDSWGRIMGVNAFGTFLGVKYALPHMVDGGGGSIVNIASIGAIVAMDQGHIAYYCSKAAVASLSRVVGLRYGPKGIRCNTIYPGIMPPMRGSGVVSVDPNFRDTMKNATALGRRGEYRDIADGALYLASDESSYVTGADLVIDGGYVIR